jgi:hypothetical protein
MFSQAVGLREFVKQIERGGPVHFRLSSMKWKDGIMEKWKQDATPPAFSIIPSFHLSIVPSFHLSISPAGSVF